VALNYCLLIVTGTNAAYLDTPSWAVPYAKDILLITRRVKSLVRNRTRHVIGLTAVLILRLPIARKYRLFPGELLADFCQESVNDVQASTSYDKTVADMKAKDAAARCVGKGRRQISLSTAQHS
jgi:hypothetical protein